MQAVINSRRAFLVLVGCWAAGFLASPIAAAETAGWQAGVGSVVITPEQPMWMSGYAGRNKPAEGKLHDLWAKALVLKNPAGKQVVLITLDLVGISQYVADQVSRVLQQQYGIDRADVVYCTSHTHCGPVMGQTLASMYFLDAQQQKLVDDYTAAFPGKVAAAVGAAIKNLEPVQLTYGVGEATFAVNRRENVEADVPRLRGEGALKGPVDHAVPTLFVTDRQNRKKAIVFGYACHATTLSFYQWNGDWPGFAQIEIEKAYPEAVAMFVAGCGADQNPLPRREVELAEGYGKAIATAVKNLEQAELKTLNGHLASSYELVDVPFAQLPTRDQIQADAASADRYVSSRARHLLQQWDEHGKLKASYPYPVQVWSIGGVPLVFLGGEVVVDYALRLKGDFDLPELWVAGYCNDVMAYIPSRRVLAEGGYEGARSMIYYGLPTVWAPDIENLIVEQVRQAIAIVSQP